MLPHMLLLASLAASVQVVPSVDLSRYAGKWFEISRLPNRFQRDCAGDVTATYTLKADGKIGVVNECKQADGTLKTAKGTARLADNNGPPSKLKVSFFWPFSGDYWILALDPEYRWALVGAPSLRYLWVLSRTPEMDPNTYDRIVERARKQGFDTAQLIRTPHR